MTLLLWKTFFQLCFLRYFTCFSLWNFLILTTEHSQKLCALYESIFCNHHFLFCYSLLIKVMFISSPRYRNQHKKSSNFQKQKQKQQHKWFSQTPFKLSRNTLKIVTTFFSRQRISSVFINASSSFFHPRSVIKLTLILPLTPCYTLVQPKQVTE